MQTVKTGIRKVLPIIDLLLAALVFPSAIILMAVRRLGIRYLPFSKRILWDVGIYPILNHYYEPLFDSRSLKPLDRVRNLPGIDWNASGQLELLSRFGFNAELEGVPRKKTDEPIMFYIDNGSFESGDAEYWYNIIRLHKPSRIIEIGSGYSTLMAQRAIARNTFEAPAYRCKHICIEPYEMPWLEQTGVEVIRQKVEDIDISLFKTLGEDDILFIDSSHIIRPQGDVVFEFIELLPQLNKGVIVHVHDIFSPRDYPTEWVCNEIRFWNEQYLLEAFLSSNREWEIISALNYLHHSHFDQLKSKCPFLTPEREPGSFYMRKIVDCPDP